jgi:hypothetical protein
MICQKLVIKLRRRSNDGCQPTALDYRSPECPLANPTKADHNAASDTRSMIQELDYAEVSVAAVLSFVNAIGGLGTVISPKEWRALRISPRPRLTKLLIFV